MTYSSRTKRFLILLGCLVLAGIVLRLIVSAQLVRADSFVFAPPPETDQATYLVLSADIADGRIPKEFYYQPFYYSVFLPAARLVFRSASWSAALAQTLCAGFVIWFAGLLGAMLKGRIAGLISGFFAAFSLLLILYVPYALLEIQQCLWMTLLGYLTLRSMKRNTVFLWGMTGLVMACAVLSRGNAWCFLPSLFLAFWYLRRRRIPWKSLLLRGSVFLLCLLLPQLPFVLRNSQAYGELRGPSTAGPAVLALGNTPESSPRGLDYPETYEYWMSHQAERSVPRRILDWALSEPAAFTELQIRKFACFWDAEDVPNNISMEYNGKLSPVLAHVPFLSSGLLFLFFLAGFLLMMKRLRHPGRLQVFYSMVFLYAAAMAVFYILARFRVPAFGLLAAGAGIFPVYARRTICRKDWRNLIIFNGGAFTGAFMIVYMLCPVYAACYEPAVMRLIRPDGIQLVRSETDMDLQDAGPRICGGYTGLPLKHGMEILKDWRLPAGMTAASMRLTFLFAVSREETFDMSINGAAPEHVTVKPDGVYTTGQYPCPPDGRIRIRFSNMSHEDVHLAVDTARDYGRTFVNGEVMPFEAVIRLRLSR